MEYDIEKIVLDVLSKHSHLFQFKKDRFTAEDLSEIYGPNVATIRRMMNRGDFGELINFSDRHKVVTLEGLLAYEASHTGFVSGKPEVKTKELKKRKAEVGRL